MSILPSLSWRFNGLPYSTAIKFYSSTILQLLTTLLLLLISTMGSVQSRQATMTVRNRTGELVIVAADHRYSDNYRNSLVHTLNAGEQTNFVAQYHTGLGTPGQDWFQVVVSFANGQVWKIEPNPGQDFLFSMEPFVTDIVTLATSLIPGGQAVAPVARQLVQAVTNNADLRGYRAHILRQEDEGAINTIDLYRNTESHRPFLRFSSPSGVEDFMMSASPMGQLESGPQIDSDVENESSEEKSGSEETETTQNTEANTNDEKYNKALSDKEATLKALKKKGKSKLSGTESRVPPGQKLTKRWPVMDIGRTPKLDLDTWKLLITGLVEEPLTLTFAELKKIGVKKFTTDFHCVTTWSKLDMNWAGVPMLDLIKFVNPKPDWKYLIQYGADHYSTNVRREDVEREDCFIAFEYEGEPLSAEHGGIRMIIPHLYGWKGSKFLVQLEFSAEDKPGFWEKRGYHNVAEAFAEQRYSEN